MVITYKNTVRLEGFGQRSANKKSGKGKAKEGTMKPKLSAEAPVRINGRRFWETLGVWALAAALSSMLLFAACCGSTETRDDTFNVGESPGLIVNSEYGNIVVKADSYGTIRVQATLSNPTRVQYQAQQDGDTITVNAQVTEGFASTAGVDIIVTVPGNTNVELQTKNGSIEVQGIDGFGDLLTSNGKIVLKDVSGSFTANTSNGAIEVTSMEGTGNLETSNGAVTLTEVKGTFDVETSNGAIAFAGEFTAEGESRLETSNGSITVKIEGTPSVELDASTSNGQVICRLPIVATVAESDHLVGTIGDGEAELVIETSNGSVTIE